TTNRLLNITIVIKNIWISKWMVPCGSRRATFASVQILVQILHVMDKYLALLAQPPMGLSLMPLSISAYMSTLFFCLLILLRLSTICDMSAISTSQADGCLRLNGSENSIISYALCCRFPYGNIYKRSTCKGGTPSLFPAGRWIAA